MKTPHWLKLTKYRCDFVRLYVSAFGLVDAVRIFSRVRLCRAGVGQIVSLDVPGIPFPISLRYGTSDVEVFEKIFVWKEYTLSFPHEIKSIVDCGGNIGLSAIWFALRYPHARIVVVEPEFANFNLLLTNTAGIHRITAIHAAIWSESCRLKLEAESQRPDSFRYVPVTDGTADGVEARDILSLMELAGFSRINLLKVDIEGGESRLFSKGIDKWLGKVEAVVVECHGPVASETVHAALPSPTWTHSVSGENDVFIRATVQSSGKEHAND